MKVEVFHIDGPLLLTPVRHEDERGFFSEVFRLDNIEPLIGQYKFVQENHSFSLGVGVLRGLHFQRPPFAQGKLVRVVRGRVLDVIVDARAGSPTYGEHISVELSWNDWRQLWVPPGFLHGFCTLSPEVEFLYKVTSYYSALHDGVVAFDDPDLDINWPFPREELNLSSKDASAPRLFEIDAPFPKSWEARPVN